MLGGVIRGMANDSTPHPDGSHMAVNKGQQIYVGYVARGAGGHRRAGAARRVKGRRSGGAEGNATGSAETWFWVVSALLFFVLTLGPNLRVAGP